MRTRQDTIQALLFALTTIAAGGIASAQVPEPWLGTWTLNVEKSTYYPGPPPYKRGTMRVEAVDDSIRMISDLVGVRGGVTHLEWSGRFDGRDYMVQGIDDLLTYAYRPLDERTWEIVIKADDRIVAQARAVLSPDGRTLTTTTKGRNARGDAITTTTVYEKVEDVGISQPGAPTGSGC